MKNLKDLFLEELADRYDSEKQLVTVMPKLSQAAMEPDLKKLILDHLKETEKHVSQLEKVFKAFGEKPVAKKCQATVGLLREGEEILASFKGAPVIDAAVISAAQKVEHYEIASYGCLHEWAKVLKQDSAAEILENILTEEKEANKKLIAFARAHANKQALPDGIATGACGDSKNSSVKTKKDTHKPSTLAA
jgi:ferritin-like metal-binding protein YciE